MILENFKKTISSIENKNISLIYFFVSFLFIILFRNFLEIFSNESSFDFWLFSHYSFFYISVFLSLSILAYIFTKKNILKIFKVLITFFPIIILPPIIDLIFSPPGSRAIGYFIPTYHVDLFRRFFLLGGEYSGMGGITLGIKIELILVIIFSFLYVYTATERKKIKSLFFSFLVYSLIFVYFSLPIIFSNFYYFSVIQEYFNYFFLNLYFIFSFFQIIILALFFNKPLIVAIFLDLRYLRLFHYYIAYFIGLIISSFVNETFFIDKYEIIFPPLPILSFLIMITVVWVFSVVTNNIEDIKIDEVSNEKRPFFQENLDKDLYKRSVFLFLFIVFMGVFAVGFIESYLLVLFLGLYFLYSMPPFRFKRVPLVSKLVISLNTFFLVLAGYLQFIIFYDANVVRNFLTFFPSELIFIIILSFLALNFIDIKDYQGDKRGGIKTILVIFGLFWGKIIIGSFFLLSYFFLIKFYGNSCLSNLFLASIAFIQFYFIVRKKYNEKNIFILYYLTLVVLYFFLK